MLATWSEDIPAISDTRIWPHVEVHTADVSVPDGEVLGDDDGVG